ncbi:hypothetical protein Bbelb_020290, partial [Branchiostoma belcheri]
MAATRNKKVRETLTLIVLTWILLVCAGEEEVRRSHGIRQAQYTRDMCDDGKTSIALDLQGIKYDCEAKIHSPVYAEMSPSRSNCSTPKEPLHKCMRDRITYTQRIPH